MSLYLITGVSGSGKTTLAAELANRGYIAYDGDTYPGLAGWRDKSGQPGTYDPDAIRAERVHWLWDKTVLKNLDESSTEPTFLCGSSANTVELIPQFTRAWLLAIDEVTLDERLAHPNRNHSFGKDEAMRAFIHSYHIPWQNRLERAGAKRLDGTQPTPRIANEILVELSLPESKRQVK